MKIKSTHLVPVISAAVLAATNVQGALVTGWSEVNGLPSANFGTASPTLGDGSEGSADTARLYASFDSISLATVGSTITLSGSATFTGIGPRPSGSNVLRDMFRMGLYNVNGSSSDTGWLGYWSANGDTALGGRLFELLDPNTGTYGSSTGLTALATATAPGAGVTFESGTDIDTYDFSLTLTRVATGMQIDTSIIRTSDSLEFGEISFVDTSVSVSDFNRVGFLLGGNLNVDTVQFNNITVVPEPSAALLGGLGLLALLHRRRN